MTPLDAIEIELARVREKIAELQIEERVLSRLLVDLASRGPVGDETAAEPHIEPLSAPPPAQPADPSPKRGRRNTWSDDEDRVLREQYPSGGVERVAPLLPGRSPGAIYQRLSTLGVKRASSSKIVAKPAGSPAASPPPAAAPAPERKMSFAQQLERVSRGEVGIVDKIAIPGRCHDGTLGGVVGEII